jgi:hypothetical protein
VIRETVIRHTGNDPVVPIVLAAVAAAIAVLCAIYIRAATRRGVTAAPSPKERS